MKFTLNWLFDHLETDKTFQEITNKLSMIGLEVEEIDDKSEKLKDFIIAKVVDARPHPNADRLKILSVDNNSGDLHQVICGAPNARKDLVGVFAKPGMYIPGTNLKLSVGEIRGEKSYGMMCSERELEISDEHDGIIELESDAKIGENYAKWSGLDDPIITIGITPNRADCLGVRGIARDLAASGCGRLKPLNLKNVKGTFESPKIFSVSEEVNEKKLVPVLTSRYFKNLSNCQSPRWMQQRLTAIGQRPISALVDITNYVMFDLNRPLHAYDGEKISGNKLEVRFPNKGEKIKTLNEKEYCLSQDDLIISDRTGADDLAGIMGGLRTGVSDETKEMFLEIAIFDPIQVSKTGRELNLHSDARYRFERGLDQETPEWVHNYVSSLVLDICGGEVSHVQTIGSGQSWQREITFETEKVFQLTGVRIDNEAIHQIFSDLGFDVVKEKKSWLVKPPSWRNDIDGSADLVEEIIRIYGYENIPELKLFNKHVIPKPAITRENKRLITIKNMLAGRGLIEAITYSFLSSKDAKIFFPGNIESLQISNPISTDLDCMRPSLLPNLLSCGSRNFKRDEGHASIFEVGPIFIGQLPEDQIINIGGLRFGKTAYKDWTNYGRSYDWLDAKADIEAILKTCGLDPSKIQLRSSPVNWFHPGRSGVFSLGKNEIAHFGEIHPNLLEDFNLKTNAVGFEINIEKVPFPKKTSSVKKLLFLDNLQEVTRDFAFIIDKKISSGEITRIITSADKDNIKEVRVFDLYEGEKVKKDEKSFGVTVIFQPKEKSFSEKNLDEFSKNIISIISNKFGGYLRD